MTRFLAGAAIAALSLSLLPAGASALEGRYRMEGTSSRNPGPYSGTCDLTRQETWYDVRCVNANGDRYSGKGMLKDKAFSLYLGEYLLVYEVRPDGVLDGHWVHLNSQDIGVETLTPAK